MARKATDSEVGIAAREGLLASDPKNVAEVDAIFGVQQPREEPAAEPEAKAAPEPEVIIKAKPEAAPADSGTPAAAVEIDYKAKFEEGERTMAAKEQEWLRQREGLTRAVIEKRRADRAARDAAPALTQPQAQAAAQQGIPVRWTDKGEAFVDEAAIAKLRISDDEIERRIEAGVAAAMEPQRQAQMRNVVVGEDPTRLGPMLAELGFAHRNLNSMVIFKQKEMNYEQFSSADDAADFVEFSGLGTQFRAQFPHIAATEAELREFVKTGFSADPGAVRSILKRAADRKSPQAAGSPKVAFDPPPMALDPNKPRPHADRGGKAPPASGNSLERELDEITEKVATKGAWTISDQERERMNWLTKTLSKKKAS